MKVCYVVQVGMSLPHLPVFKEGEEIKMFQMIEEHAGKIVNEDSKAIVRSMIENQWDKLPYHPPGHQVITLWGSKYRVSIFKGMLHEE